jgi:hypothetical protein
MKAVASVGIHVCNHAGGKKKEPYHMSAPMGARSGKLIT